MGVSAAISILAAVLISIITLPAILGMIGHRLSPAKESRFWQKINGQNRTDEEKANRWGDWLLNILSLYR